MHNTYRRSSHYRNKAIIYICKQRCIVHLDGQKRCHRYSPIRGVQWISTRIRSGQMPSCTISWTNPFQMQQQTSVPATPLRAQCKFLKILYKCQQMSTFTREEMFALNHLQQSTERWTKNKVQVHQKKEKQAKGDHYDCSKHFILGSLESSDKILAVPPNFIGKIIWITLYIVQSLNIHPFSHSIIISNSYITLKILFQSSTHISL